MTQPRPDARFYSREFFPAKDTPIQFQSFEKQLVAIPDTYDLSKTKPLATIRQRPSVIFQLHCLLWRFTTVLGPGQLGKTIKVFTCEMDGTRVVPGMPWAEAPRINPDQPTAGEQIEMHWGKPIREKTGRAGEDLPFWFHLTRPFIESVDVSMGFPPAFQARLVSRAPATDEARGSVSSSVSYAFNLGIFGKDLTGGISADYSHSNSMDLKDYVVRSESDAYRTKHTVELTMLDGGIQYSAADFWKGEPTAVKLPPRATGDMDLAMQGIWELPDVPDVVDFDVTISLTLAMLMSKTFTTGGTPPLRLCNPGVAQVYPPGMPFAGDPVMDRDGTRRITYDPYKKEDERHTKTTFTWKQVVKIDLSAADKPTGDT